MDEPSHAPESRVGRFFIGASLAATAVMRSVRRTQYNAEPIYAA